MKDPQTLLLQDVASSQLAPLSLGEANYLLLASETRGLVLIGEDGSEIAALDGGSVERFALQARGGGHWLVAAYDEDSGKIQLRGLEPDAQGRPRFQFLGDMAVDAPQAALCFSRQKDRIHLFAIDESGLGREYLLLPRASSWGFSEVRPLYFGEQVSSCAVDNARGKLLVAQPPLGIWRLNADAERDEAREVFVAPDRQGTDFGGLWVDAAAGHLWVAAESGVWAYDLRRPLSEPLFSRSLDGVAPVSVAVAGGKLLALEEESNAVLRFAVPLPEPVAEIQAFRGAVSMPHVAARAQTAPVASGGDAADDPAIWVNPRNTEESRILGTDKKRGLNVYDLNGKLLQALPVGRVNNVDLRPLDHARFAALAAASNRTTPGVSLFGITADGEVESLGLREMDLADPYGLCLSRKDGGLFVWMSDKQGDLHLAEIRLGENPLQWQLLPRARQPLAGLVEGCVADDERGQLFYAEEDRGIWRLDIDAFVAGEGQPQLVARVDGDKLVDDIEGMALYLNGDSSYLVVSSQGNNSYALFSRDGSEFVGRFRVDINPELGIDGVSETDGLEVTSAALGADYPQGVLVVQDGRNRLPSAAQNFKLISWTEVADALALQ
ncbi:phytase [Microbulbifer thermotolerans]|uniref:phytase n=1 Tax=Microbulbifer thermotolerans TaxID=252514 RepID=UPI00224AD515|nr:phytase [Microbulbifer thermotolerans]MCX2836113.1 phytase [Microbulbifer thermotolerans]